MGLMSMELVGKCVQNGNLCVEDSPAKLVGKCHTLVLMMWNNGCYSFQICFARNYPATLGESFWGIWIIWDNEA